jgi:hypothetical protein
MREDVFRILVTGGPPNLGGGGMSQRIMVTPGMGGRLPT